LPAGIGDINPDKPELQIEDLWMSLRSAVLKSKEYLKY